MQLNYRGHHYAYTPVNAKFYINPRAVNWRFQVPNEINDSPLPARSYEAPRAINWRYRTPNAA